MANSSNMTHDLWLHIALLMLMELNRQNIQRHIQRILWNIKMYIFRFKYSFCRLVHFVKKCSFAKTLTIRKKCIFCEMLILVTKTNAFFGKKFAYSLSIFAINSKSIITICMLAKQSLSSTRKSQIRSCCDFSGCFFGFLFYQNFWFFRQFLDFYFLCTLNSYVKWNKNGAKNRYDINPFPSPLKSKIENWTFISNKEYSLVMVDLVF